ncbi:pentapeptide repeat-containing protein [Micromonospora lupini]|uniref:pentapeptide repeat-containing protein n=1 Tax=Micromonospora lupini TaxID=285679 RepID=UPI0033E3D3C9
MREARLRKASLRGASLGWASLRGAGHGRRGAGQAQAEHGQGSGQRSVQAHGGTPVPRGWGWWCSGLSRGSAR